MRIPKKVKVATYLIYQFEHHDFDFDVVYDEETLQDQWEEWENKELLTDGGNDGNKLGKRNERYRKERKKKKVTEKKAAAEEKKKAEEEAMHEEYVATMQDSGDDGASPDRKCCEHNNSASRKAVKKKKSGAADSTAPGKRVSSSVD